ncbi:MAG: 16S rRNA (cytosine(1402)-N(4))-methyltransferase RsmH [Bacteroidia bacterium]|nr:16S rRNA (cytosine(1402)-N(4))-methyltransferase RsmH [Bacteroidia bacterium]
MSYHVPVLLKESIEGLAIKPNGTYLDLTYGGGGHSGEILKKLEEKGRLIAFDQDSAAQANIIKDKRFQYIHGNFRFFGNFLRYYNISHVDGILADLGVSGFQFDFSGRGFSFRKDEKLDMRMNTGTRSTAEEILNNYDSENLTRIFGQYGDIHKPDRLTNNIIRFREKKRIRTTRELKEIVGRIKPSINANKYLAKIFQSLRIEVNKEKEALIEMLNQIPDILNRNGRLVIISYHSLEDRIVKNFIRNHPTPKAMADGCQNCNNESNKDCLTRFKSNLIPVNKKVIVPSADEIRKNNRARSAKMRIAEKVIR